MYARREIGKWLNEEPNRELDRKLLAELCADYDMLERQLANVVKTALLKNTEEKSCQD